jgi:hypothetical protein
MVSAAMPVVNSLFFIKTVLQKEKIVKHIHGALRRKLAERTSIFINIPIPGAGKAKRERRD